MKRVASDESGVVGVEVVVQVVVVRVPGAILIAVKTSDNQVVIRVAICIGCLPYHHPLNTLGIELYFASSMH